jgi:hypothetical protein
MGLDFLTRRAESWVATFIVLFVATKLVITTGARNQFLGELMMHIREHGKMLLKIPRLSTLG